MSRYFVTYVEAEKVLHALEWFGCLPDDSPDFATVKKLGLAFRVGEEGELIPDHVMIRPCGRSTKGSSWTAPFTAAVADAVLNAEDYARMRDEANRWRRRMFLADLVERLNRGVSTTPDSADQGGEAA